MQAANLEHFGRLLRILVWANPGGYILYIWSCGRHHYKADIRPSESHSRNDHFKRTSSTLVQYMDLFLNYTIQVEGEYPRLQNLPRPREIVVSETVSLDGHSWCTFKLIMKVLVI